MDILIKQAASTSLPQTSPPHIALTVQFETDFLDGQWEIKTHMHNPFPISKAGLHLDTG
jgi:hypothetical protein